MPIYKFSSGKYSLESDYPMDMDEICFVLFEKDLNEVNEMRYDLCEYLQDDMREFFKQNSDR